MQKKSDISRISSKLNQEEKSDPSIKEKVNANTNLAQELSKKIKQGFAQIEKNISCKIILEAMQESKKLGVTNYFFNINLQGEQYIVRINGKLWPPYKREEEAKVLLILKEKGINTHVLFNGDEFQISTKASDNTMLNRILESNNTQDIEKSLTLVAKELSKYHAIKYSVLEYPLAAMLENAEKTLYIKLKNVRYVLDSAKLFGQACHKILKVLQHNNSEKIFSHNDLLPSSIFINLEQKKVSIVDWEYCSLSYWSNDIALLSRFLNKTQKNILACQYHFVHSNNQELPKNYKFLLDINEFIHQFLNIAWKMTEDNVLEFQQELTKMEEKLNEFTDRLNTHYNYLTTKKFFPPIQTNHNNVNADYNAVEGEGIRTNLSHSQG